MKTITTPNGNWTYGYDRRKGVWRAYQFATKREFNAYEKLELMWQIENCDVEHLQEFITPTQLDTLPEAYWKKYS
jgi:hypothetical protein